MTVQPGVSFDSIFDTKSYAIELTALLRRETFLDALFLWYTPLVAAISIAEIALVRAALAASLSFAATAASTFFIAVFTAERIDLFLSVFVWVTRILFFADLILAKLYTSYRFYVSDHGGRHGKPLVKHAFLLYAICQRLSIDILEKYKPFMIMS